MEKMNLTLLIKINFKLIRDLNTKAKIIKVLGEKILEKVIVSKIGKYLYVGEKINKLLKIGGLDYINL